MFPAALMLLILLLQVGGDPVREALRFERPAIADGQWWRLLTGNLVHLGWWHLFLNEMGVLVLMLLCPDALPVSVWLRRLAVIGVGMSLGLYFFEPRTLTYVGLSGVMHGLFLLGLGRMVLQKDLIATGCLLYLLGKLGWELWAGAPLSDEQAIGGRVSIESHFWGAVAALAYGLIFRSFTRLETFRLTTTTEKKE